MKRRVFLILYFTLISCAVLFVLSCSGKGIRLSVLRPYDMITGFTEGTAQSEAFRMVTGERAELLLTFFLIAAIPTFVFLSGFTMFSVSVSTVSSLFLSAGTAATVMNGESSLKTALLLSLALAGTILTGAYSAEHRSSIRFAAPQVGKILRQPATKRYIRTYFSVCAFLFFLTAGIMLLPLP